MNSEINTNLVSIFMRMAELYDLIGDIYRGRAYFRQAEELKKLKFPMDHTTLSHIKSPKMREKINEFITTGKIHELEQLLQDKRVIAAIQFGKILGVGPATIKKWVSLKIFSIPDLRKAISSGKIVLNHIQKLGLKFYHDLNIRIPRQEVKEIATIISSVLIQLDPHIIIQIVGSYRRGAQDCGDVDMIITNKSHFDHELIDNFIEMIHYDPYYVDCLSKGPERCTFLYKMSDKVRQIDILNVPYDSWATAILYFTGDFNFNISMRDWAKIHGYKLNQHGLFKSGKKIPTATEHDIFDKLGIEYIPPPQRTAYAFNHAIKKMNNQ